MLAYARAVTGEAFTPSALPDFVVMPPSSTLVPSARLPVTVALAYSTPSSCVVKSSGIALVYSDSPCVAHAVCDPGEETALVTGDPVSVAYVLGQSISLPIVSFGATYRIQRLTLHLATFLLSRAISPLTANTGRMTNPFPEGFTPS